jgi:hypothetical protein
LLHSNAILQRSAFGDCDSEAEYATVQEKNQADQQVALVNARLATTRSKSVSD